MIASAIAYLISGFFVLFGIFTIAAALIKQTQISVDRLRLMTIAAVLSFFAAWGCAYLGGI